MNYEGLILEQQGAVCLLTMNCPATRNAFSNTMVSELEHSLNYLTSDSSETSVVILTGTGNSFVAGADIRYMSSLTPMQAERYTHRITALYRKMEESKVIFIAAVNGYALGGGLELVLACDLCLLSSTAKLGLPECGLGIIPGGGGTQRLPRLIGPGRARELIYTGRILNAEEAFAMGISNRVVAPESLLDEAYGMANLLLKNSSNSVGLAKEAIYRGGQMALDDGMQYESKLFSLCFSTEDQQEGMEAFLSKRRPVYSTRQVILRKREVENEG